uniref:Type I polyketide synthase n=1 Tax=Gambierdiscus excentricus TaxID=986170 RepID=A0A1S6K7U0_9DINO|nr:type I polyketide synthase [Gambierdiscus excentricus]
MAQAIWAEPVHEGRRRPRMPPTQSLSTYGEDCDVHSSSENFSSEVVHYLGLKGFCIVGTTFDKSTLAAAQNEAKEVDSNERFYVPPALVVEGLLGSEGSSAVAELEPFILEDRRDGESLQKLDMFMTEVAAGIDEYFEPNFGFLCGDRTVGLLHEAGKFSRDEPIELTEKIAGKWLQIFRRHRLMMVICLGTKGGNLTLRPFDEDSAEMLVPIKYGQMAILRADFLAHSYTGGTDKDLLLSCWILQRDRAGARGAFADGRDGMPVVPAAMNLVEWANTRLKMIKANAATEAGSLADQEIPRNWKLMASHTVHQGIQCAVRGLAINMPVRCENMASYAGPLTSGTDFAIEIPFKRWDHFREGTNMSGMYHPEPDVWRQTRWKTNIKHATFIEGQDLFDNKFFNMSVLEGKVMDPNQRLGLESAYEALHVAGYTKKSLMQAFIGVYQGHTASDWDKIEHEQAGGCAGSYSPTIASNRVSFALGIMGPSFTIDVEGAASLAAVYQGAHDIIPSGDWRKPPTTASVCGGHTLNLSTYWWPVHNQYMSIVGRCLTFDAAASGYIKGEGVCTAVLKRHGEMVEGEVVVDETQPNLGIIAGWSMINSGANAGLAAPSGPSMQRVVADSVRVARISPLDVDAIETHGSGQYIHDATEVSCLAKSLRGLPGGNDEILAVNSSKSKLGFAQETAGIAAFFGVLVSQRMGIVSPNVHLKALNPYVSLEDYAVTIGNEPNTFRTPSSFHGITAYGWGGTNVHTLLHAELDQERYGVKPVSLDRQVFAFWPAGGGELEDDLKAEKGYMIMGSWTQWDTSEKMKSENDGSYSFVLTLGPNRYEHFQIIMDSNTSKTLHPGQPEGSPASAIFGPEPQELCAGMSWLVDGRSQLVARPASTVLNFTAHAGALGVGGDMLEQSMTLAEAKSWCETHPECQGFCYFGGEEPEGPVAIQFKNTFTLTEKVGWTSFRKEETALAEVGEMDYFKVSGRDLGMPGDLYKIKLQLAGKWKTVTWDKISGTGAVDKGSYYFVASWNDWELQQMEVEVSSPNTYFIEVTLPGSRFARYIRGEFLIVRNKDWNQTFFPADTLAAVAKNDRVGGPGKEDGINWQLQGEPGEAFRIEFQRAVAGEEDTKKVNWTKIEKPLAPQILTP